MKSPCAPLRSGSALGLTAFLTALTARAQEPVPAAGDPTPPPRAEAALPISPDADGAPSAGAKADKKAGMSKKAAKEAAYKAKVAERLSWGGRVVAGGSYEKTTFGEKQLPAPVDRDVKFTDLGVSSARVGLRYEPRNWLLFDIEWEVTSRNALRDGFLRFHDKGLRAQVGQFKLPASALTQTSISEIPLARRGFTEDMVRDRYQIAGRRPGAMAAWRGPWTWRPELTVGAFMGGEPVTGAPFVARATDAQTYVARGQVELGGVTLGLVGERLATGVPLATPSPIGYYYVGGADLAADFELGNQGLRLWADAFVGQNWRQYASYNTCAPLIPPCDAYVDTTFRLFRALAAWRLGGLSAGDGYVEIFGMFSSLEPSTDVRKDLFREVLWGINAGEWKRHRLTLQLEWAKRASANTSALLLESNARFPGAHPAKHFAVVVMANADF